MAVQTPIPAECRSVPFDRRVRQERRRSSTLVTGPRQAGRNSIFIELVPQQIGSAEEGIVNHQRRAFGGANGCEWALRVSSTPSYRGGSHRPANARVTGSDIDQG
jgi:hypothetical protein